MDKKSLTERDICTKFITPAILKAGWDIQKQVLEEFGFTAGRIMVRGKLHSRGERKRADYLLSYQKNLPLAVIEAKDNKPSAQACSRLLVMPMRWMCPLSFPVMAMVSCFMTAQVREPRLKPNLA